MTMARPSKAGTAGFTALGLAGSGRATLRRGFGAVSGSALGDGLVEVLVEGLADGLGRGSTPLQASGGGL